MEKEKVDVWRNFQLLRKIAYLKGQKTFDDRCIFALFRPFPLMGENFIVCITCIQFNGP